MNKISIIGGPISGPFQIIPDYSQFITMFLERIKFGNYQSWV